MTVSLDVLVADDDATARELALPEAWAMARSRQTGEFPPLEDIAAIRDASWPGQVRRRVEASLDRAVAGSPSTVRRRLDALAEATGADELLASGSTYDREALLDRVWGYDYFGDGRLVDVHVRRLRTKVEADPANPRHVVTVRGLGYRLQT